MARARVSKFSARRHPLKSRLQNTGQLLSQAMAGPAVACRGRGVGGAQTAQQIGVVRKGTVCRGGAAMNPGTGIL